eukprot:GGOE01015070.1.p1 GENE.GGOE01015070.1~~GGOE01015070.1.p1  ORF type:complete len:536 (+),score=141.46 GGOE01015070.1:163-1608(+)
MSAAGVDFGPLLILNGSNTTASQSPTSPSPPPPLNVSGISLNSPTPRLRWPDTASNASAATAMAHSQPTPEARVAQVVATPADITHRSPLPHGRNLSTEQRGSRPDPTRLVQRPRTAPPSPSPIIFANHSPQSTPSAPPSSTTTVTITAYHAAAARRNAKFCAPFVTSLHLGRPNAGTFNCARRLAPLHRCQKVGAGKQGYAMLCHANVSAKALPQQVAVKCSTRTDKPAQAVHEVVVACRLMLLPLYNVTDSFVWILDFAWCNESQTKDFLERVQVHDGRLVRRSPYRTFISYQLAERTPKGRLGAAYIFEMVFAILAAFQAFQVGVRDLQQKHLYCVPVDYARVYEADGAMCVVRSRVMVKLIDLGAYGISSAGSPGDLLGLSNYYHLFRTASLLTASAWDLYTWTKDDKNMGRGDIGQCLKRLVLRMAEYDNGEYRHDPVAPLPAKVRYFRPLTPVVRTAALQAHPYASKELRTVKFS